MVSPAPINNRQGAVRQADRRGPRSDQAIKNLIDSKDVCTKSVSRAVHSENVTNKLVNLVTGKQSGDGGPHRLSLTEVDDKTLNASTWRKEEFEKWCKLRTQGVCIKTFKKDKVSNSWLSNLASLPMYESSLITALQLRTNTAPCLLTIRGTGSKATRKRTHADCAGNTVKP